MQDTSWFQNLMGEAPGNSSVHLRHERFQISGHYHIRFSVSTRLLKYSWNNRVHAYFFFLATQAFPLSKPS
jgi:hypothetical protein